MIDDPGLAPRRTWFSNRVFGLLGGNEDNDLWVHQDEERLISTWVPTDEQRRAIADGANIDLHVWGSGTPPVALTLSYTPLGKRPKSEAA